MVVVADRRGSEAWMRVVVGEMNRVDGLVENNSPNSAIQGGSGQTSIPVHRFLPGIEH